MMGIRTLLLAAFVISNVSWTTSRHHFRHHGNAHGTRHRRQDKGLYHPASYVIPGGLGTGPWGNWEDVSPCSRTCGGGVASQKRICIPDGPGPNCTGGDTKYFSCQTQECPENAGDFRGEQCSEFDHLPYRNSEIRYTWIPYTKAPNPCELNCMPRGERFYYKQRAQVVDGTRCNEESFDVCVAGVCQPVGCDMMLGSTAREDKCRNCRGNGTNCHTLEGLLDTNDLIKGYNDMLLIPQGATNIYIEEVRPSNNYLALRGKTNGEYYLNGKYQIVSPNSFIITGTLWHYERSAQGIAAPDKLRCMGPTREPLYLSLILQDYNVGIRYEYSVPSAIALPLNEQYNWVHKSFSECSASCGGGFQVREVACRSREELNIVDDKLCGNELKPPTNQTCNIEDCPPRWVEGPWSPCSRACGDGGTRSRLVSCEKIITNRETFSFPSMVVDEECFNLLGPKPESYQRCNQNATCPIWFIGPWKPCNRLCGEGKETRIVVCHKKIDGFVQLFEDSECDEEKPITEKACLLHPCDGVDWVISEWSGCDTCLSTVRTRVAHCATKDHKVIDSNLCSYHPSPVLIEKCDRTKLPSCQVQWYATQWSNCSVECGTGVRTRRVFCGLFDGASVIKVDDERCDAEYKYNDTTECVIPKEKCSAKWFAGPWSECTKKCGGGEQSRRVMCLSSKEDLKCDNETILHSTQSCNTGPCNKDDLLPLDSKSNPVLDDYDEEDCIGDDDEYPEVGAEAFVPKSLTRFPEFSYEDITTTSTTDISNETESGSGWIEISSTDFTESSKTAETTLTDVEITTEPDVTTSSDAIKSTHLTSKKIGKTKFPEFSYEDITTTSTTDISNETESGSGWIEISSTDFTESSKTAETTLTDVDITTEPEVASSTESSTTENYDLSSKGNSLSSTIDSTISITTENGSTTLENGSSTTENIEHSTIFSTESSITDTDSATKTSSFSITDDGKSSITENESTTIKTTESDLSITTETTVSGTTENGESTSTKILSSTTESTDSSTIVSTLYSTQESSESSTTENSISITTESASSSNTEIGDSSTLERVTTSTTENNSNDTTATDQSSTTEASPSTSESSVSSTSESDISSTTESALSSTTTNGASTATFGKSDSLDVSTTEGNTDSTTAESSANYSTESSTTGSDEAGTSGSTATIQTRESSTSPGSTDGTSAESSTDYSTESKTTNSDATSTSGSTKTTETGESSTSPGSTTAESSTHYSTESSTTESDKTGTSGSTETSETTESSTSSGSTTPESSTHHSTESSTTGSEKTGTSGSTETSVATEISTSPGSTRAESSTYYSTESSTTGSDKTGTSGSTVTTETTEISMSPGSTSTTESDKTGTSGSTKTTETIEISTSPGSTTAESSTYYSTESSTTGSDTTGISGSSVTTETTEISTSPGSSTAESSTHYSTESSTTESDKTGTSGSTETYETTEISTSSGSTTAESSTYYSTESSTTGSDKTGTSGSTVTTETTEISTSPGSTTAESSTHYSTESSTTESDKTGTSGSTETYETTEISTSSGSTTAESSTNYSTDPSTTDSDETGTSGSTETNETAESSTSPDITDASTSPEESLRHESSVTETSPYLDWASTVEVLTNKPRCKLRKIAKCTKSKFGCCPDKRTPAAGPFDEGCPNPETCKDSKSGCCPDGVSPAAGPLGRGCPISPCNETLYGCCSDNVTAAEGNNQDGCPPLPPACESSKYGCCDDNDTEAMGPEHQGCPEIEIFLETTEKSTPVIEEGCATSEFGCCFDDETDASGPNGEGCPCSISEFGCCPDGITTASGSKMEGCLMSCNTSAYGCCPDGETPAHGSDFQGCCLQHEFGCCPDNYGLAKGPNNEGCGCEYSRFGCCPDNITIARGPYMEGCGCEHSRYGCCPDRHTEAQGLEFIGCECHTYQFGCCPDGVTIASGPELEGCRCGRSKYGCCGDETTSAKGPNMEGCDCSNSKYGCCPDGETEAKGDKFQNCSNVPVNKQAACALNHIQGTCRNYTALWFYDMEYGGCSQFWYGGCDGNANRFVSREECEDVCVRPSPKDTCNLPKVKASCEGYNVRWYYNSEREQCSQFVYGGCLGNANNFDTKEICEERCEPEKTEDQCNLALERGPCAGHFVRWGFNAERRRCEQFLWGGCGGNKNRYDSEAACQLQCTPPGQPRQECLLPQDAGNCTEKHPVWSFNNTDNRCVPFYYSGCGGNDNRFNSEHSCDDSCPRAYVQEICTLPAMIGDCSDYTIKWFFDTTKKRCRQFYYGGCNGNENNFLSESECENRCTEQPTTTTVKPELLQPLTEPAVNLPRSEFCLLDIDKGPCTQSLSHWAYDVASGACVRFQYGGCGGNRNNFPTLEYCERYCRPTSPPQDVCQLPVSSGPCDQSIMQWFYDTASKSCSNFTYGGCEGNGNRFNSLADCEQQCHVQTPQPPATTAPVTTTIAAEIILPSECQVSWELENCMESGVVWFLDVEQRACVALVNEGPGLRCRHTGVFHSQEACERTCGAFQDLDTCGQSLDPGNCNSYFIMWYYDSELAMCNQFVYGGCDGNDNRFQTQAECESRCKKEVTTNFIPISSPSQHTITTTMAPSPPTDLMADTECATPVSLAPCGVNVTVYYFDTRTKTCLVGDFGACRYSNSYRTEEECQRRCGAFKQRDVCGSRLDPGPCLDAIPKFYWDSLSGSCRSFAYGGCRGGPNRFSTVDECEEICGATGPESRCLEPVSSGTPRCGTPSRRWYYNTVSGECAAFVYSGCGGNDNNFYTYEECARCKKLPSPVSETETGNEVLPDCDFDNAECAELQCEFGVQRTRSRTGCERCICNDHPCANKQCSSGERCVATPYRDDNTLDILYSSDCRLSNKSGSCPLNAVSTSSIERRCRYQCRDDADCLGVGKCCERGCSKLCLAPAVVTSPAPTDAPYVPEPPQEPSANLATKPEVRAKLGGTATLICLFHGNPPPKITWQRGQLTIEGDVGRYRLLSDGSLEIVSLYRNDSGVYICIADNGLGIARQEVNLQVDETETGNEVLPDCDLNNAECEELQCEYGVQRTLTSTGCERCICNDHPCANKQCSSGERCVATPYRDDNTLDILYSSDCRLSNKSGSCPSNAGSVSTIEGRCRHQCNDDADCLGVDKCCERGCSKLCLEAAVATTLAPTVTPYVPETGNEVLPDCDLNNAECAELQCEFGVQRTLTRTGCERCICNDHPCANKQCLSGERCVATPYRDAITHDILYSPDCRLANKSGLCPSNAESVSTIERRCRHQCNDDADCLGVGKCCERGCSKLCLEPTVATSPAPTVAPYVPEPQQEPSVNTATDPEVRASLGGKATLRCLFHGNPPPKITWKRRHFTIEGDVGRYRLLSDGALEIVSVYRNDSGVYICIADNGLGIARQEVNLQVDDGVKGPAGIAGSSDAVVVGELGQPLSIRCMAYGYPKPSIYWYRGSNGPMVPYSSVQYEARDNVLQIKKLSIDTLGKYSCQTYNGIGKPVDWSITVKAYRNNEFKDSLFLVPRQNEVVTTPRQPQTEATTTIAPEIKIPMFTVPVATRIISERTRVAAGSELSLLCEVAGYPIPEVYWTKDSKEISSDDRITVSEQRLTVSRVNSNDTGVYGCHAFNAYNSHYSSVHISVEGLYIPPTCKDNPFFANCHLIVRSKFCSHKYYSSFCCKSCVEAGQLNVQDLQLQADDTLYRK